MQCANGAPQAHTKSQHPCIPCTMDPPRGPFEHERHRLAGTFKRFLRWWGPSDLPEWKMPAICVHQGQKSRKHLESHTPPKHPLLSWCKRASKVRAAQGFPPTPSFVTSSRAPEVARPKPTLHNHAERRLNSELGVPWWHFLPRPAALGPLAVSFWGLIPSFHKVSL